MARYTIELREIMNNPETAELLKKAMSTYPMYEKRTLGEHIPVIIPTREELNMKILNHYKYREIAFDTVGRFIDELEISLNEIMPYYYQVFFSVDQDYDLLHNVDYKRETSIDKTSSGSSKTNETGNTSSNGTSESSFNDTTTSNTNNDNNHKEVESDTPQGQLNIGTKGINDLSYGSKAKWASEQNNTNGTTTGTGSNQASNSLEATTNSEVSSSGQNEEIEKHLEIIKGNYGQVSFQSLLDHYRQLIINVERKIINDERISELFMRIF